MRCAMSDRGRAWCIRFLPVFAAVLFLALSWVSCSSGKKELLYVQPRGGASLYQEPAAGAQVLALIPANGAVEPKKVEGYSGEVGGLAGQWIMVKYKDIEGWMFDRFLAEEPIAALRASYVCEVDPFLELNMYAENKFMMKVNLCAGIGTLHGTYAEETGRYLMAVQRRDFSGFAGDDIQEFAFLKVYDNAEAADKGIPSSLRFSMPETNSLLSCGPYDGYVYVEKPLEQE